MLSRYPGMPRREADDYLSRIESPENAQVGQAVIGRMDPRDLPESARAVYNEFHLWSLDRTRRFMGEQVEARRKERETKVARQLLKMRERGQISEDVLKLYGISGHLPERVTYQQMTAEEQNLLWNRRMEDRWGSDWRSIFINPPIFVKEIKPPDDDHDWINEGF